MIRSISYTRPTFKTGRGGSFILSIETKTKRVKENEVIEE